MMESESQAVWPLPFHSRIVQRRFRPRSAVPSMAEARALVQGCTIQPHDVPSTIPAQRSHRRQRQNSDTTGACRQGDRKRSSPRESARAFSEQALFPPEPRAAQHRPSLPPARSCRSLFAISPGTGGHCPRVSDQEERLPSPRLENGDFHDLAYNVRHYFPEWQSMLILKTEGDAESRRIYGEPV